MGLTQTQRESAQRLLEDFLNTPSVNGSEGERKFAEKICTCFQEAGLEAQLEPLDERRANVGVCMPGLDRSRNMVLNGHLDTVKYGDLERWATPPHVAAHVDGRLFARGAADMKAGLAGMVFALLEMKRQKLVPPVDLNFIASCDEEAGGAGAAACLEKEYLKRAEFILIGEPTSLQFGLSEKACNWLKLIVHGKTGHGAYPERGVNAIEHGFRLLERVKAEIIKHSHPLLGGSTMQITQFSGGIAPNMTPDLAEFVLDIRNTPDFDNAALFDLLKREIAAEALACGGLLSAELKIINSRPPLETSPTAAWVKALDRAFRKTTGNAPQNCGVSFFTDASLFVQANKTAPILLFGPGEAELCHQPNESVELSQYERYIEILLEFFKVAQLG